MAVCGRLADFSAGFLLHNSHGMPGVPVVPLLTYENSPCRQSGRLACQTMAWPWREQK